MEALVDDNELQQLFTALQPESRRILLELLAKNPGLRHKELAILSGLGGTCWHHLMFLSRAGLITRDVVDKNDVAYYINEPGISHIITYLQSLIK